MGLYNLVAVRTRETSADDLVELLFSSHLNWCPCFIHYDAGGIYTGGFSAIVRADTPLRYAALVSILGNCGLIVVPEDKKRYRPIIGGIYVVTSVGWEEEHVWFHPSDVTLFFRSGEEAKTLNEVFDHYGPDEEETDPFECPVEA